MPAGNISAVERMHRITKVKELHDEGKTIQQIADDTGMALTTVKRNLRYAKEIGTGDLVPADINEKRAEIELEIMRAIDEAYSMFEKYKDEKDDRWTIARGWHRTWTENLNLWMKLYGLDSVKIESLSLINNQHNYIEPEHGLSREAIDKIADAIEADA